MKVAVGASTDVGRVREGNEDSYFVDAPLFAVADGMGGHAAGDIASATAVETIQARRSSIDPTDPDSLAETIREANRAIWDRSANDPNLRGMGTTCTMILVDGERALVAHVGDSRAYQYRNNQIRQVTEDHTLVGRMVREGKLRPEEAAVHPQRSMVTRALGVDDDVEVDVFTLDLVQSDRILICSDGLTGMLSDDDISEVLANESDPQAAAEALVRKANEAGGEDNITVVIIDVGAEQDAAPPVTEHRSDLGERVQTDPAADTGYHRAVEVAPKRRRWLRRTIATLVVLGVLAGAGLFAVRYTLDNSWFIGVDETGVVTIYRGIPDDVAGITLHEVHERSSIELTQLPEFKRDEVEAGIKVDSLEEAEATMSDLEQLARDKDFSSFAPPAARPY